MTRRPPKRDSHHYADWIELSVLLSPDREFSRAEAIRDLTRTYDVDGAEETDLDLDDETAPGISRTTGPPTRNVDDAFRQLDRRQVDFDSSYPFRLSGDRERLELRRASRARTAY